jgi:hypothetical protein
MNAQTRPISGARAANGLRDQPAFPWP